MIKNAKIVGIDANPLDYHAPQSAKRGTPEYVMSVSALRIFGQCPSRWVHGYEPPQSDAKDDGSLFDTRLLTPGQFQGRYAVLPETYESVGMECPKCGSVTNSKTCRDCAGAVRVRKVFTKPWSANAAECQLWKAEAMGPGNKQIVSRNEVEECDKAISRFVADEVIASVLDCSDRQVHVTAEWHDEKTGLVIPLRSLMDLVPRLDSEFSKCIADVKRSRNAAPMPWQRWCFQVGLFIQGAFYLSMLSAAEGSDRNTFVYLLSESYPPYETGKRMLDQDFTMLGRAEYTRLLENYCACLKANRWPGYDDTDEAVQGWSLVQAEPFMAERAQFAPKFDFEEEAPGEVPERDPDEVGIIP